MASQLQDKVDDFYKYTSITEPGTIRVIKLEPSLDIVADLHCSLECKRLDDFQDGVAGHYTALSYVWGDATDVRIIFVGGRRLEITASLHCALRHLRHTQHPSYVWADGTCINQPDVIERNIQVSMMGSIYKTAHRTIIFLGPSCTSCSEVMESISSNARNFTPAPDHHDILSKHILSHPWFTRVWTLQELVLSKNTWVQKGTSRVPWETFSQHVYGHCTNPADKQRITDLINMKTSYWNPLQTSSSPIKHFHNILRQRRGTGVSDPRDMVFGHLGLCPPTHESVIRSSISIDYSQTPSIIFEAVARQIVLDTGDLSLLEEVEKVQPEDRRENLPSWVPDWTVSMRNEPAQNLGEESDSKYLHGQVSDIDSMFATPHVLVARGTYVGSIRIVFSRLENLGSGTGYPTRQEVLSWVMRKESQPIVHAVCTVVREICERLNVRIWEDDTAFPYDNTNISMAMLRSLRAGETGEFCQLITNLYRTSQGPNAGCPEDSEILLGPEFANFLLRILRNAYFIARLSPTIAFCENGEIATVTSQAREGDLLCYLEGSRGMYVVRHCVKEKDKDKNNRDLVSVKPVPERQTNMEKVRQDLGSVRMGEEEAKKGTQMSLDVRLVDFVSIVTFRGNREWMYALDKDNSTSYQAVFSIH